MKYQEGRPAVTGLVVAVVVGINSAAAPVNGQAQMTVPAQFSVSPSGAANYSIPIPVPPAPGGLTPSLALTYSSQSGNGLLGVGWALSGISSITRCPQTLAQDGARGSVGYDVADRYCLDGQRLLAISGDNGADGTEYRTEQDGFAKITSYAENGATNGPGSFVVKTKTGLTMEFGKTADSRIEAQGKVDSSGAGPVAVWALNKVVDAKGNKYIVNYYEDNSTGQYYATSIMYGSGSAINFTYEARPDTFYGYTSGSKVTLGSRLKEVAVAGNLYTLQYDASTSSGQTVLKSIKITNGSGDSLGTLQISRQDGVISLVDVSNSSIGTWNSTIQNLVMDVNGDGKADLVRIWPNGSSAWADVWLANTSGNAFTEATNSSVGTWNNSIQQFVMDVNGDGKADLVRIWQNGSSAWANIWIANAAGTGFTEVSNASVGGWNPAIQQLVMDVNGDGKADLVRIWQNGSSAWADVWLANAGGNGFTEATNSSVGGWSSDIQNFVIDVDGDGRADLVRIWKNGSSAWADVWLANQNGTGFSEASNSSICGWGSDIRSMDVNADGKTDLVCIWQNGSNAWANVWLAAGKTFVEASNASVGGWSADIVQLVMDVNGDGKPDLVRIWQNGSSAWANIWLANALGTGFTETWNASVGTWNTGTQQLSMDVNGDGKADIVRIWQNGSSAWADVWTASGLQANLVSSICDSFSCLSLNYQPLTQALGAAYQAAADLKWPTITVVSPMSVVVGTTSSNGVGGQRSVSYAYGDLIANIDPAGRGSAGFRWTQSKDASTGLVSRTCYRQDWPYVGMVDKVLTATSEAGLPACNAITDLSPLTATGSSLLSLSLNKYTFTATNASGSVVTTCKDGDAATCASGAIAPGKRYQVYGFESYSQSRDWDGTNFIALPANHTTQAQDSWGNVTSVMSETLNADGKTASGYSKTTTNTYLPADTSSWLLGRLKQSQVKAVSP